MKLYLDTETRSATKISLGVHNYIADPHFQVLICTWAVEDGPVQTWQPVLGEAIPAQLAELLQTADVVLHNSSFDRRVIEASPAFPTKVPASRIIDTKVQAYAHGLPGALMDLSTLCRLGEGKGKQSQGKQLIQQFCVPIRGSDPIQFYGPKSDPKAWQQFCEYARHDVDAMREVHRRIPTINYPGLERKLWVLDQQINDRGLPIDLDLAKAANAEAVQERAKLNASTKKETGGEVSAATQRDALLLHLAKEHDIWLPDLKADTLDRFMALPGIPEGVRKLIELRQQSSLSTAAKYRRVLQQQINGRIPDTLQMYGASRTGRDAGRIVQPQNFMRPTRWRGLEGAELEEAIETDIQAIKAGAASLVDSNVMDLLGNCIRGVIRAEEGKKLVVADLSNIEGRVLVWLAGEEWKIQLFRDIDSMEVAHDNYVVAYAEAMNVPVNAVTKYQRAIGKAMELGLGYGGGVSAFINYAAVYRLDLDELADAVWKTADPRGIQEAHDKFEWAKEHGFHAGLARKPYAACEYLKTQWRLKHPATVEMWAALERAFRDCVEFENREFRVGMLRFVRKGQWLYIRLPSGRVLTYLQPKIVDGTCTFIGQDPYTRRIDRIKTYSGKLAENVTSGTARDLMFHRLPDVEDEGYAIVLRVHDELVCETPDLPKFSGEGLAEIMVREFPWSKGLPLAAEGFETKRYRK